MSETLSDQLRRALINTGLSDSEISRDLGVSRSTACRLRNNEIALSPKVANAIFALLNGKLVLGLQEGDEELAMIQSVSFESLQRAVALLGMKLVPDDKKKKK